MKAHLFACRVRGGFVLGIEVEPSTPNTEGRATLALGFWAVGVQW